jgi:RNA polymerase sigma-70 factor (ECF subfamily)
MEAPYTHNRDPFDYGVPIREESIGELQDAVSQYLPVFFKRAYRYVGNPHDAEDAVQDALLSAWKHLDQFKGTAKMTTWLTSIVTNSALGKLRRKPRHPHISVDERIGHEKELCVSDILADTRSNPEIECIRSELHGHIMESLTKLSAAQRQVIQMRDLEGLTTSEVAKTLGLSEVAVKAQVSRARSKLRQLTPGSRQEKFV